MDAGRALIVVGAVILAVGLLVTFAGRVPFIGRLPGDTLIEGDRWSVSVLVGTSIVLSVVLTVALNAIAWLARR